MNPVLSVRSVTKRFGGLTAVNGVSLDLGEGEILGIIGPNGAGKTTLFNVISGAIPPDEGEVVYGGDRIDRLAPYKIASRGLVRTFQVAKPFTGLTVLENVMVGAFLRRPEHDEAKAHARAMLERTGLDALAERQVKGLTLSARKRLELARALATDPTVLLLDEVLAGLTPTEGAEMVKVVQAIREGGVSLLVIEHVMAAIMALSDRVAVIHHGELLAIGPPAQIAKDPPVVAAYLGEEFQIAPD
jgi:ABC-type branched-subunit amino acid transport system ATPase component